MAASIAQSSSASPWRAELRATLSLAWPLILANLTMQLIQATDVVLLGWLGPRELAAAALALSLSFGMVLLLVVLVGPGVSARLDTLGLHRNVFVTLLATSFPWLVICSCAASRAALICESEALSGPSRNHVRICPSPSTT